MNLMPCSQAMPVKLGAHSWLLETRYPLPEAMARARAIGYDGYELDIGNFGGTGLGLQVLPDRLQHDERESLRRAAIGAGIQVCSLCLGCLWHYPISCASDLVRQRGVEIILASIPLASFLGARCILLPVDQPRGLKDSDAWRNTLTSLEPCVRLAEDVGIILAIENVGMPFLLGPLELSRIVDEISSPACRIYYDVGNNTGIGQHPGAEIAELGDRIFQFHFKNRSKHRGLPGSEVVSVNRPGVVQFDKVMRAIESIGFCGYFVVEVPTLNKDADLIARENFEALRSLVAPSP